MADSVSSGDLSLLKSVVQDEETYKRILETFGGCSIYFPKLERSARHRRMARMHCELIALPGMSTARAYEIIAEREHLSVRHVRRIIQRFRTTFF